MAINLIRNSRVFFTTNVDAQTGVVDTTGFDQYNTFEIQVMDGFSFSQNTNADTITLNEAGPTPIRGQRSFNSSLAPVDFSFSTYMRPKLGTNTLIDAEEKHLWNALAAAGYVGSSGSGWTAGYQGSGNPSSLSFANSDVHQLAKFGIIIVFDATTYTIDNAAMDQATIDFGIDAISMVAWTGKGTKLNQLATPVALADGVGDVTLSGGLTGTAKLKDTTAKYIANKLSTAYISSGIGAYTGSNSYTIALTGGSITIANNLSYLTPANLGTVNQPITYFTGTRAVTGTMSAYLKTGTLNTAALLTAMLAASATSSETEYSLKVDLGGITNATRVALVIPGAMLQIPAIKSEAVISADINFTAEGYTGSNADGVFNLEESNEIEVRYYTAP